MSSLGFAWMQPERRLHPVPGDHGSILHAPPTGGCCARYCSSSGWGGSILNNKLHRLRKPFLWPLQAYLPLQKNLHSPALNPHSTHKWSFLCLPEALFRSSAMPPLPRVLRVRPSTWLRVSRGHRHHFPASSDHLPAHRIETGGAW